MAPALMSVFSSSPTLAPLAAYWAAELRAPLLQQLKQVHPPAQFNAPSDAAALAEVPQSLRRALSITPRASFELARGLASTAHLLLLGLDSQLTSQYLTANGVTAGAVQGILSQQLQRMLRGNVLAHRLDMAGRAAVRERGHGPSNSLSPGLVRFLAERLLVPQPVGLPVCPRLSALFVPASGPVSAEHSAAFDCLASYLAGALAAFARELLESAGVLASATLAPSIQAAHLRDAVHSRGQDLFPLSFSLEFSGQLSVDAHQVLERVEAGHAAQQLPAGVASSNGGSWWSAGPVTDERKEAALDLVLLPSKGGYSSAEARWGITLLSQVVAAPESAPVAAAFSAGAAAAAAGTRGSKRGAAAAAGGVASSLAAEAKAHEAALAAAASSAALLGAHQLPVQATLLASNTAGPRRLLADVEVLDGQGHVLSLRVERWLGVTPAATSAPAGADGDEDMGVGASANGLAPLLASGALGRVSNMSTGRVLAELLPAGGGAAGVRLLVENEVSAAAQSAGASTMAPLEINTYVPRWNEPALTPQMQQQQQEAAAAFPVVLRQPPAAPVEQQAAAFASSLALPPFAQLLQQVLWLLDGHADAAAFASAQPLALRVDLRQALLRRLAFADVQHDIARTPNVLQIIAEYDPILLPHTNLPPALAK